ncbi:exonuclease SbcCD subunit D [Croceicoccus sp. Ery15]|uniref:exonuclease SbcCD subunit D n=1 Tax=Croceicoccus sp. Ery15 TaxID=1703338 RepID=UPI001E5D87C4|nr:exonuclease SbcCD subunit D [Croceicoccus sp. Ery15]|tara:strand:- start:14550 stop:15695 length:1146 start_codon:yes stop_codon:yes gene_type:complete
MRILHTSDWHLGRQFHGLPLDEDHDVILDQIAKAIEQKKPDVLIIAGDIFDRVSPPQSALTRFGDFIKRVTQDNDLAVVAIAGNHDSAAQIGMLGVLPTGGRALVRGPVDAEERPLIIEDEHGPVAISALPFCYEFAARACFEDEAIACPADVLRAQVESARRHLPDGARWVIVAHAFVEGASASEGERPLSRTVGGIETVPSSAFDGAHYVALGHLHRPQKVGATHIRYSGAPLAFGLDEEGDGKSMTLIDLAADGSVTIDLLPLNPSRTVRTVRGKLLELIETPEICHDFTGVVLTDETPQIDPMKRIREKFPNAVKLTYDRNSEREQQERSESEPVLTDPKSIIADFLQFVRDEAPGDAEQHLIDQFLVDADHEESAA